MAKTKTVFQPSSEQRPLIELREYQKQIFRRKLRRLALIWRRQAGKSHALASQGMDWMMETPGVLVTFISASIVLGQEILLKEVKIWMKFLELYRKLASQGGCKFESNVDGLDDDAVADIFQHSKLETKLWHDRTTCSRSRVIAPNPDTAVGWTGHIIGDEFGRWPNCQEVLEAVIAFISSQQDLKLRLATTPPPDDAHYSYEMFLPPDQPWPINPVGNWYKAPCKIQTHRLSADDMHAAGYPLYHDDTGEPVTPEEHRAEFFDKISWDRNFGVKFIEGGSRAVSLSAVQAAMVAGRGICEASNVTESIKL